LDRKVIGSTRYSLTNSDAHTIEIGWSFLSRDYWGGEYNKSIKGLMINHAFTMVEYVVFYIGKNNIRSQKAVEKIGGRKILTPRLRHLRRTGSKEWTYLIIKNDWLTASR
jgi:RimJ/RimL family protein N-acetyltransferase